VVFILAIAVQTKISLSSKILRNLGRMPKTFTHVLSTSRQHTAEFLVKSFGKCCGSIVLTPDCYWPSRYSCSEVCVRVGRIESRPFTVGVGFRQGCVLSPLLFIVYIRGGQTSVRGPHPARRTV